MPQQPLQHFFSRIHMASQSYRHSERGERDLRLGRAHELIEDCYAEGLSLDEIASTSFMSPHHFHRLFRARYGVTPHQLVTQRRMHRAQQMLRHTSMTVTEVCMEVGFESLGSFSSAFRKHTGHAPSHYRRRYVHVGWNPLSQIPACLYMIWGAGKI
jgi:AraC-like DNA-binding protein